MWRPLQLADVPGAETRLSAILGGLASGNRIDLVSPLLHDYPDSDLGRDILATEVWDWCKLGSLPRHSREHEETQRLRIGTMSRVEGYTYSLEDGVKRYYTPANYKVDWRAVGVATRYLQGLCPERKLRSISLDDAASAFRGRSSFGWPVLASDPKYFNTILSESREVLERIEVEQFIEDYPAVLGTRTVSSGPYKPAKARVVFQCSRVFGNIEQMIRIPLFNYLRDFPMFSAWKGLKHVDQEMAFMLSRHRMPVYSLDFKNFDATVPMFVLYEVFEVIKDWFTRPNHVIITALWHYFMACGLVTPNFRYRGMRHGIPSGSVMTNLVGSLVNVWVMRYAACVAGAEIERQLVQGDDGVYQFTRHIDQPALIQAVADIGMTLSADKSDYSFTSATFLQNVYRPGLATVGVRPIMRVLNGMMSYERFKLNWKSYLDTLRWMQQMDNAHAHPCFRAFVSWFMTKDKHATLPVDTLISRAGGVEAVSNALSGGEPWSQKTSVVALEGGPTARMISELRAGH